MQTADVFHSLAKDSEPTDVILSNLFLHQFDDDPLREMLRLAALRAWLFIACEPRRSPLALAGSKMLGLIGCNSVTRNDAVVSVRAGFTGREISTLWPAPAAWAMEETSAGLFSHSFWARRR